MTFLKKKMLLITSIILSLFSFSAWSGQDPVGYAYTPTSGLPSTTTVGNSYAVVYTFTNHLPFAEPIQSVTHKINGAGFTIIDHCAGKTLPANGGTCTAEIIFLPVSAGTNSVQLIISYDKNTVPLPTLSTVTQGSDPSATITGVVTQPLPAQTIVSTGYTVTFSFTNNSSSSITASSLNFTGNTSDYGSITNNCTAPLAAHNTCTITGTFTPSATGNRSIGAIYAYSGGSVTLTTSTVSKTQGSCVSLSGFPDLALPVSTYRYADNVVKFNITNNCDTASATLGAVSLTGTLNNTTSVNNWLTKGDDTCSNQTLAANSSCYIYASVVPTLTGNNLKINASINYTQSSQSDVVTASTTANNVLANSNTQRIVTIINQCNVPVWMTFVAAAVPNSPSCTNSTQCPTGSTCNTGAGLCYFTNPSLDGHHQYGLMAAAQPNTAPDTMDITISEDNSGTNPTQNILYNAGIAARLGCTSPGPGNNPIICTANNCGSTVTPANSSTESDGQCAPGIGLSNYPGMTFNAVEFTFLRQYILANKTTDGVYDEQTINGVNVPIEMKGRGSFSTGTAPYNNCQPAGAPIQQVTGSSSTQLGNCAYNYTTPSGFTGSNYRLVTYTSGATDCSTNDSLCSGTATDICGLSYNTNTGKIDKRCGSLIGYVSVNVGVCSQNVNNFSGSLGTTLQSLYNCNTNYTYSTGAQLYACSGTYAGQSCYNPKAGFPAASCCGCVDWWTAIGGSLTVPTSTGSCGIYVNPDWASPAGIVQPQIQWVKSACPTAYSFQYDDHSSQFICTVLNSASTRIVTNYQVTFCPGGKQISYVTPSS